MPAGRARLRRVRALGAGLLALAGCGGEPTGAEPQRNDASSAAAPASAQLPTANQLALAVGVNDHCGCVLRGECATLDEIYGHFEVRNAQCAVADVRKGTVSCRYESRFVEMTDSKAPAPSAWQADSGLFTHYAPGHWCAGEG